MSILRTTLQSARRRLRGSERRATTILVLALASQIILGVWVVEGILATSAERADFRASSGSVDAIDSDNDGVPDAYENAILGTDPLARAPLHELPEEWIKAHGLEVSDPDLGNRTAPYPRPPESPEIYGPAGLPAEYRMTLFEAYEYGKPSTWNETDDGVWPGRLDPTRAYMNDSNVPYSWLIREGVDPFDASRHDRVPDVAGVTWTPREAYQRGLHALSPDGDRDGLPDVDELRLGTSPRLFSTAGSGIADGWLVGHGFDALDAAIPFQDTDNDGLTNIDEFLASVRLYPNETLLGGGLDPKHQSTIGGPIPDGWLVRYDLDPLDPRAHENTTEERDLTIANGTVHAVLTVHDEYKVNRLPLWNESRNGPWWGGTDPRLNDTDSDGLADIEEIVGWNVSLDGKSKRVRSDPTRLDSDVDGLIDMEERRGVQGNVTFPPTDPSAPDTDFDGLTDGQELGVQHWRGILLPRLDPTNPDTDDDGVPDGDEAAYWMDRFDEAVAGSAYAWGPDPHPLASAVFALEGKAPSDALGRLLPGGDMDGDKLPNVADPDSDNDGLLDGWEVKPELYRESPYVSERSRSATDPANNDTDRDVLPDAWEVRYGLFDYVFGGWNLDPSLWSSFRDDVSDADRDLDGDSALWYSFHEADGAARVEAHEYKASNLVEFRGGSDPNRKSSSPDGIPDGWKLFWGTEYLGLLPDQIGDVYPGAPGLLTIPQERTIPRIGHDDSDVILANYEYLRWVKSDEKNLLPWEAYAGTGSTGTGGTDTLRIRGQFNTDYRAVSENQTNPYLDDTDGDGMPDSWETTWARLGTGQEKVSAVKPDAEKDPDSDGLANAGEWAAGTNPYLADSDFGQATDDIEVRLGLDPLDPSDDIYALNSKIDSDGDGVYDNQEKLGRVMASGLRVSTNPNDPDTDHDGLLDGQSLSQVLDRSVSTRNPEDATLLANLKARGLLVRVFEDGTADVYGEAAVGSDPTQVSTPVDGVPDGWAVANGLSPARSSGKFTSYAYGRPTWWNETRNGVWWWGLAPDAKAPDDSDNDGLKDLNGEDPIPFANQRNVLPRGDPRDVGLGAMEALFRGQAYGDDPLGRVVTLAGRVATNVLLDPIEERVVANGTSEFSGRLLSAMDEPVPNATVLLSLEKRQLVIGSAITNQTGHYRGSIVVQSQLPAPPASAGVTVFGSLDGDGVHSNDGTILGALNTSRPLRVFAWNYNASVFAQPRQDAPLRLPNGSLSRGWTSSESDAQNVTFTLASVLVTESPASARIHETTDVKVTLTDALGRAVPNATVLVMPTEMAIAMPNTMPMKVSFKTDPAGKVNVPLTLPGIPGTYEVEFSFAGREPDLLATRKTVSILVVEESVLRFDRQAVPIRIGDTATVAGSLVTSRSLPVAGADITVTGPGIATKTNTSLEGRFTAELAFPITMPPGVVTLEGVYQGTEGLNSTRTVTTLTVTGLPKWIIENIDASVGAVTMLRARLVDLHGAPLPGRNVVTEDAKGFQLASNATDSRGFATFPLDYRTAQPGERLLVLRFSDAVDGTAEKSVAVSVFTPTKLSIATDAIIRGEAAKIWGNLTDVVGRPLAGQRVSITLGSLERSAVTNATGQYLFGETWADELPLGRIAIAARYDGSADNIMKPSSNESLVAVRDRSILTLTGNTILRSDPFIEGWLRTGTGNALPQREVLLIGPGGAVSVATDSKGYFRGPLSLSPSQPLGKMDLRMIVRGNELLMGSDTSHAMFLKDRGQLKCDGLPTAGLAGKTASGTCQLLDSTGRSVRDVLFAVAMEDIRLQATGSGDEFSFTVPASVPGGPHSLRIEAISETLLAEPLFRSFEVQEPTTLRLTSRPTADAGQPVELRVALDLGGRLLANETLMILGVGPQPLKVTTNAKGEAVIALPPPAPGSASYQIAFAGNGTRGPSFMTVIVPVLPAPAASGTSIVWMAAGAVIILAASITAWFFLRRRKHDAAEILKAAARRLSSRNPDVRALYDAYLQLLLLSGLTEDKAETLTFGDLVSRFVKETPETREDLAKVTELFNRAVYAPQWLETGSNDATALSLQRLSRAIQKDRSQQGKPEASEARAA
ncbi:MAG: carboxypeptidase regulatory-like domain-containing protein [Euryarchaeota archaeon]|nr:carboxypeptidase regulatory-like domain-containing protein [Euryarchaeota archaeon]